MMRQPNTNTNIEKIVHKATRKTNSKIVSKSYGFQGGSISIVNQFIDHKSWFILFIEQLIYDHQINFDYHLKF